jgi:hypothetical protein
MLLPVGRLRSCFCGVPSLTRGRVCNFQCNHPMVRVAQTDWHSFHCTQTSWQLSATHAGRIQPWGRASSLLFWRFCSDSLHPQLKHFYGLVNLHTPSRQAVSSLHPWRVGPHQKLLGFTEQLYLVAFLGVNRQERTASHRLYHEQARYQWSIAYCDPAICRKRLTTATCFPQTPGSNLGRLPLPVCTCAQRLQLTLHQQSTPPRTPPRGNWRHSLRLQVVVVLLNPCRTNCSETAQESKQGLNMFMTAFHEAAQSISRSELRARRQQIPRSRGLL